MTKIPGLKISEAEYKLPNNKIGKIAVLIYHGNSDPKKILDSAVRAYVGENGYHELIDAHLDNPRMRVLLSDINGMEQKDFDITSHSLKKLKK
ncbi:MAG: hypothetical protein LIR40_04565 [Bacteroidota bacterium]|nr:hypothetical protein [Bacteroidota bacterium]